MKSAAIVHFAMKIIAIQFDFWDKALVNITYYPEPGRGADQEHKGPGTRRILSGTVRGSRRIPVGGNMLPAARYSFLCFDPQGNVVGRVEGKPSTRIVLAKAASMVFGKSRISLPEYAELELYKNGKLECIEVSRPVTVIAHGRTLIFDRSEKKPLHFVRFYPNGQVMSGTLGAPALVTVGRNTFMADTGSFISFDKNGTIIEMTRYSRTYFILAEDTNYWTKEKIFKLEKGTHISLGNKRRLTRIDLVRPTAVIIGGRSIVLGSWPIELHENGEVKSAKLEHNTLLPYKGQPCFFVAGSEVSFNETGEPVAPSEKWDYEKYITPAGNLLLSSRITPPVTIFDEYAIDRGVQGDEISLQVGDTRLRFTNDEKYTHGWSPIEFHYDHIIKFGYLKYDTILLMNGSPILFAHGKKTFFHQNGIVEKGFLAQDSRIRVGAYEFLFSTATSYDSGIIFSRAGKILKADLGEKIIVSIAGRDVTFGPQLDNNGHSARDNDGRDGFTIHKYDMTFYEDGAIESGALAEDTLFNVGGCSIKATQYRGHPYENDTVHFYPAGELRSCRLACDTELMVHGNTIVIGKGTRINFSRQGLFLSSEEG